MTKIKKRNEVLTDVIKDAEKHPKGWKSVYGKDNDRLSNDYYMMHPRVGIYLLKEYPKNPYERVGVGGKIARQVDSEIEKEISKTAGDFGIIQGDFQKILKNLERGIKPEKIMNAALDGKKDYGLSMPVRGKVSNSKNTYKNINDTLSNKQKKIASKFEKVAKEERLYSGYD